MKPAITKKLEQAIEDGFIVEHGLSAHLLREYYGWCEKNSRPYIRIKMANAKKYVEVEMDMLTATHTPTENNFFDEEYCRKTAECFWKYVSDPWSKAEVFVGNWPSANRIPFDKGIECARELLKIGQELILRNESRKTKVD